MTLLIAPSGNLSEIQAQKYFLVATWLPHPIPSPPQPRTPARTPCPHKDLDKRPGLKLQLHVLLEKFTSSAHSTRLKHSAHPPTSLSFYQSWVLSIPPTPSQHNMACLDNRNLDPVKLVPHCPTADFYVLGTVLGTGGRHIIFTLQPKKVRLQKDWLYSQGTQRQ